MKDSRFIELLNLYIDRQISAAETAELEAEIQNSPKRQAVYRQYCQIHSATKTVYESFRAVAADQPAPTATGQRGVVELFETRRRRTNWAYYAGGLAAAACLTLVFMRDTSAGPATAPALATQTPSITPAVIATTPATPAKVTAENNVAPGFVSLRDSTSVTPDYTAMLTALREQDEERAFHNERLQVGRVRPLFNDDMFDAKRAFTVQDGVFRSQPAATSTQQQQADLSAAFQFQR